MIENLWLTTLFLPFSLYRYHFFRLLAHLPVLDFKLPFAVSILESAFFLNFLLFYYFYILFTYYLSYFDFYSVFL